VIAVSGIDEQKIICPFCKKEPEFWVCDFERGRCWLLSDRYLASKRMYSRHVVYEGRFKGNIPELEGIELVRCKCTSETHPPGSSTYVKVLRKMKDFRRKEGINFNSGGTGQ